MVWLVSTCFFLALAKNLTFWWLVGLVFRIVLHTYVLWSAIFAVLLVDGAVSLLLSAGRNQKQAAAAAAGAAAISAAVRKKKDRQVAYCLSSCSSLVLASLYLLGVVPS